MAGYIHHLLAYASLSLILTLGLQKTNISTPQINILALYILFGAIYSLLPDIDMPNSVIRKTLEKTTLSTVILCLLGYILLSNKCFIYLSTALAALLLLLWSIKHRGFFHSIPAALLLSLPTALINPWISVFAFTGYISHLIVDKTSSVI